MAMHPEMKNHVTDVASECGCIGTVMLSIINGANMKKIAPYIFVNPRRGTVIWYGALAELGGVSVTCRSQNAVAFPVDS